MEAISNCWDSSINPIDLSRGRYGGTYVHEDLAIDYAAWISPTFKLEVYRPLCPVVARRGLMKPTEHDSGLMGTSE